MCVKDDETVAIQKFKISYMLSEINFQLILDIEGWVDVAIFLML